MEKKTRFGDLKVGDYIYKIVGLRVYDLKIVKIYSHPIEQSITFCYEPINGICGSQVHVGRYFSSSNNSTVFVEKKEAWERLISYSKSRYDELMIEIDERITEFDKLEKFLRDVKEKDIWRS